MPSVIVLVTISCKRTSQWGPDEFFEQSFKTIQQHSVKKNSLNWADLKETVRDSINVFDDAGDAYRAIGYTLKLINDGHSVFFPPQNAKKGPITNPLLIDSMSVPVIKTRIIDGHIGYIKLPGFFANDSLTRIYSLEIRKALMNLDHTAKLSGWIIDLRRNSGGKMPSESLGLSPLFQNSFIGIACGNENFNKEIRCTKSQFYFGNEIMDTLDYDSILTNKDKPVAVLVSERTVSAGEFLALAFQFQEHSKVFGSKTKGKTSHLRLINFKSNAKLLLAVAYFCDKNGNTLKEGIMPDVECGTEEVLGKAIEWIEKQNESQYGDRVGA